MCMESKTYFLIHFQSMDYLLFYIRLISYSTKIRKKIIQITQKNIPHKLHQQFHIISSRDDFFVNTELYHIISYHRHHDHQWI